MPHVKFNLTGMTSANQMFTSCTSLETIYATSFSNTGLSGSLMFNSCNCLVGGTDGFVPSTTSGASVCKLGAGEVLTDPNDDQRSWFYGHFYEDGEDVLIATQTPDPNRALRSTGRICAIAKYQGLGFTHWTGNAGSTHRQYLTSATFAVDMATLSYLNLIYLFYGCTNLATINGLGNLSGVRRMRYTYGHACCPIAPFVTNEDYAPNVLHKRWTEHASRAPSPFAPTCGATCA